MKNISFARVSPDKLAAKNSLATTANHISLPFFAVKEKGGSYFPDYQNLNAKQIQGLVPKTSKDAIKLAKYHIARSELNQAFKLLANWAGQFMQRVAMYTLPYDLDNYIAKPEMLLKDIQNYLIDESKLDSAKSELFSIVLQLAKAMNTDNLIAAASSFFQIIELAKSKYGLNKAFSLAKVCGEVHFRLGNYTQAIELINSNEISIVIYYYILISSMFMLRFLLV